MSKESKAREYWIDGFKFGPDESVNQTVSVSTIPNMYKLPKQKRIHVIEYSAYEKALKMCEELAGALEWIKNPEYFSQSCIPLCNEKLDNYRKWKEGVK